MDRGAWWVIAMGSQRVRHDWVTNNFNNYLYAFYFTLSFYNFPSGSDGKESTCNKGDPVSDPRLGRCPGGGHGNPLQYSCLDNSIEEIGGL